MPWEQILGCVAICPPSTRVPACFLSDRKKEKGVLQETKTPRSRVTERKLKGTVLALEGSGDNEGFRVAESHSVKTDLTPRQAWHDVRNTIRAAWSRSQAACDGAEGTRLMHTQQASVLAKEQTLTCTGRL